MNVNDLIDNRPVGSVQKLVIVLCACVALLEGFDAQVIAYLAPAIAEDWVGAEPSSFGTAFSAGLLGLMLGALAGGPMADRWGRKQVIVASALISGIFMTATAHVENMEQLIGVRFLTGLGLGGGMPNVIALTSEYSPRRIRTLIVTVMFSGFPLGSVLGGLLSAWWIPELGWRSLCYLGGILPVVTGLILALWLPESLNYLVSAKKSTKYIRSLLARIYPQDDWTKENKFTAHEIQIRHAPVISLFSERRAAITISIWAIFFMNLLVMYFMVNWLPTLLTLAGYGLSLAIVASTAFNLGGVCGGVSIANLVKHYGPFLPLAVIYFLVGILVVVASVVSENPFLTFPVVFVLGFGVVGSQFCLNALAADLYPTPMRSTGVGWALGIGRIGSVVGPLVGGWLLTIGWAGSELILVCVLPALVASLSIIILRKIVVNRQREDVRSFA